MSSPEIVQVAALVPVEIANSLKAMADERERSMAAEIRLALKAWIEEHASTADAA